MDLVLWRHAEAVDALEAEAGDAADLARTLTPRGERQAAKVAAWLHRHLPDTARVLVSPAQRTRQTAEALERKFRIVDALAPQASVSDVLEAARWPSSRQTVLVVGHQPTLGLVASTLLTGQAHPLSLRKGAVWWLRNREREGGNAVALISVVAPEQL